MWGLLKKLLKGNSSDDMYKEIRCGEKVFTNVYDMANIFNKYLVDSVSMNDESDNIDELTEYRYTECTFDVFSAIEIGQLSRLVNKLENKIGTEEDITVGIMKKVVTVAGVKICYIMNKLLEEGIFPNEWKKAIVIPILKIKKTKKVEEFRPINKLPIYEKILEIIVHR